MPVDTFWPTQELTTLGAATLHEALGRSGALDPAIKPLDPAHVLVGPAFTVRTPPGNNLALHRAIQHAAKGAVLVVDGGADALTGLWGDLLTEAAMAAGIAGIVLDGAVRDTQAIRRLGFKVFARSVSMRGPGKADGALDLPIVCGGEAVCPGDLIVGDADGVVVIPAARLAEVLTKARQRAAFEEQVRAGIQRGETTLELLGLVLAQ